MQTWRRKDTPSYRRVAIFAATLCLLTTSLSSLAAGKSATLKATGYSGTETLSGFPALVKLSASNDPYGFSYADCAAADGSDIWFSDVSGKLIPHDIDTWNVAGDSFLWVRIPELTNNAEIVMHWGAVRTAEQTCIPSDTWRGYVGVWHMSGTGAAPETDRTANGLNATPLTYSSASTNINTTTGTIGASRAVTSDGKYLSVGSSSHPYHSAITTKANFSISGWWRLSSIPAGNSKQRLVCGTSPTSQHSWEVWRESSTQIGVRSGTGTGNGSISDYEVKLSAGNTWHYLTIVWKEKTATVYENGTSVATKSPNRANTHPFDVFTIGGRAGTSNCSFVGAFDEVRMYDGVLSADRIAADYATMSNPTAFLTLHAGSAITRAEWTGAAGDGNICNSANWNCIDETGNKIDDALPTSSTAVTVSGDGMNFQVVADTSFECLSLTLGNVAFAVSNGGTVSTTSISSSGVDVQTTVLFDGATVRAKAAGNIIKDIANMTIGANGLTLDTTSDNYALAIDNSTLKVTPGETPPITLAGGGSLDLSNATIGLTARPSAAFDVIVTADGATATFSGTPAFATLDGIYVTGWQLCTAANRTRLRICRKGVTLTVY